jgi:hypothetical protein
MSRLKDWEPRLVDCLGQASGKPFKAGHHDCALFVAACVEAMTGTDLAAEWRGRYRTIRGGIARLRRAGHADHVACVASMFEEVLPTYARRGDIGVVDGTDGFGALGIVQGEGVYVLTESGLGIQPRRKLKRAFQV